MLSKSEKKELKIWYNQIKSIQDIVNSKCNFILNRIYRKLDKDIDMNKNRLKNEKELTIDYLEKLEKNKKIIEYLN